MRFALAVLAIAATSPIPASAQTDAREVAWIEKGKAMVLSKLKDPSSAEFKDVFFFRGSDGVPMTCGQVNGKNAFGGRPGFRRFISASSFEMTFIEDEVSDFSVLWSRFCGR